MESIYISELTIARHHLLRNKKKKERFHQKSKIETKKWESQEGDIIWNFINTLYSILIFA